MFSTSKITSTYELFNGVSRPACTTFNDDIDDWDTSKVTAMTVSCVPKTLPATLSRVLPLHRGVAQYMFHKSYAFNSTITVSYTHLTLPTILLV